MAQRRKSHYKFRVQIRFSNSVLRGIKLKSFYPKEEGKYFSVSSPQKSSDNKGILYKSGALQGTSNENGGGSKMVSFRMSLFYETGLVGKLFWHFKGTSSRVLEDKNPAKTLCSLWGLPITRALQGDVVYLSWPIALLVYEPKCGGGVAGSQPMRTAVHITWHGA